jgi:hypothetical protein
VNTFEPAPLLSKTWKLLAPEPSPKFLGLPFMEIPVSDEPRMKPETSTPLHLTVGESPNPVPEITNFFGAMNSTEVSVGPPTNWPSNAPAPSVPANMDPRLAGSRASVQVSRPDG